MEPSGAACATPLGSMYLANTTYLEKSMRYIMVLILGIAFGLEGIGNEFVVICFGDDFAE